MLDLKESAERPGCSADGMFVPLEAAARLPGPVIVLLYRKAGNHFVILS